jgi:hypothetical protein
MKIENEFKVNVTIDEAWQVLTDLEGVVTCLPGAQLTGVEGDTYTGNVKIKVGPIISEYSGTATFVEKDDAQYRAVINAKGRDARGAGSVAAMITAQLRPEGDRTIVSLDTDLKITGKVAQFGNAMIVEVSEKLLDQFVANLEVKLAATSATPDAGNPADTPIPSGGDQNVEAVDLMKLAGGSVAKRLAPIAIGVVAVVVILVLIFK